MKRHICALFALCLIIILAACQKEEPATEPRRESDSPLSSEPGEIAVEEDYPYGNLQKNAPSGNFMLYGNKVVFLAYTAKGNRLCTYDTETGEVSLFFKDATSTESVGLYGNLESYDGKLYGLDFGTSVIEISSSGVDQLTSGNLYSFCHNAGSLYVKTKDSSLMVYENGKSQPRTILDEYTALWSVGFGQYIYANGENDIIRVRLDVDAPQEEVVVKNASGVVEGHHIYYIDDKTCYLYRCNMDGSDPVLLLEQPVLLASMNFDNDYFYFRLFPNQEMEGNNDCYDLYRFPKSDPTQIEKIVTLPMPVFLVYTVPGYDKIFVNVLSPWAENGNREEKDYIYIMGTDGSNPQLLELPDF